MFMALSVNAQDNAQRYVFRRIGKKEAPVKLYLFSSFSCPHCKTFHEAKESLLIKKYIDTGKASLTFIELARDAKGMEANKIARCIPPKDYQDFISDVFYSNEWRKDATFFQKLALKYGMDQDAYEDCLEDEMLDKTIKGQQKNMLRLYGVRKLPSIVVVKGANRMAFLAHDLETIFEEIEKNIKD